MCKARLSHNVPSRTLIRRTRSVAREYCEAYVRIVKRVSNRGKLIAQDTPRVVGCRVRRSRQVPHHRTAMNNLSIVD